MNKNEVNIKQDIVNMCHNMSQFFLDLKDEFDLIPEESVPDIIIQFEDYFSSHSNVIDEFSNVKTKIREIESLYFPNMEGEK